MTNKTLAFLLTGIILLMAACGGQPTPAPAQNPTDEAAAIPVVPARPAITMNVLGETYEGLSGAYCWPQAADDIRCEPDPLDPQSDESVSLQTGDEIEFIVADEAGTPSALTATMLGNTDADGDPLAVYFGPSSTGLYPVDLAAGEQNISVVAEFQNLEGDNSFVTYYFALDVTTAVAEAVTPRPSATAPEQTEETAEATEEPAAVPTKGSSTEEATSTQEAPEVEPTTEPDESAAIPTKGASESTDEATPTEDSPVVEEQPTVEEPTATAVPTTEPPTAEPTAIPPTAAPPTPTAEPAATTGLPTPPAIVIVNGDRTYQPSGIEYCTRAVDGSQVCIEMPATTASERILINNSNTLRIDAADNGPQTMTISLTGNDLTQVLDSLELPGSAIALYTVSAAESGNYMLRIDADWGDGIATYYFRLQVLG